MFSKKRKDTTYLKVKDGKVVNTKNPYPTEEDFFMEQQNKEFYEHNKNELKNEDNPQSKKSKGLIFIGLLIILSSFSIIGFNVATGQLDELQKYMIIGTDKTNNINTDINQNTSITSVIKKDINVDEVLLTVNKLNTTLNTHYSQLRNDVILYSENKESLFVTMNKFKTKKEVINKSVESLSNNKNIFTDNNQQELYDVFTQRYDLLLSTVNVFEDDINKKTIIETTNLSINQDNLLLDKEIQLLKLMLKNNNINFTETDDGIKLKD